MTVQETAGRRSFTLAETAFGLLLAVYLALVVGFAWNPTTLAQELAAIGILAALVHAVLFYGWKDALALFAICVAVTFAMENMGSLTGFPFGIITSRSVRTCRMSASSLLSSGRSGSAWGIFPGFWPERCSARRHARVANSSCWRGPSSLLSS